MVGLLVGCIGRAGTLRTQDMVLPQLIGWAQKEKIQPKWLPCTGTGVLVGRARRLSWGGQRNKKTQRSGEGDVVGPSWEGTWEIL